MVKNFGFVIPAAVILSLGGCGPCARKEPPPPTPLEETLTEAVATWAPGQWCAYRLTSAGGKKADVAVSLTGKESRVGRDYFWLEVVVTREGQRVITKALLPQLDRVSFLESGKDLTEKSERLIVKVGDEPALELPLKELQLVQKFGELTGKTADLDALFGGGEGVSSRDAGAVEYETLSAKKVTCKKLILSRDGRDAGWAYVAADIPIFGVAYSEHEKGKIELIDWGPSGATTNITEEPQRLEIDLGGIAKEFKGIKIK